MNVKTLKEKTVDFIKLLKKFDYEKLSKEEKEYMVELESKIFEELERLNPFPICMG